MKIAKAAKPIGVALDRLDQLLGAAFAHLPGDAENFGFVGITNEMRIERFAVTGHALEGIQIRL